MKIEVQHGSGFCFGVTRAVEAIEENLQISGTLKCLGQVVHNPVEISRLLEKGMELVDHSAMEEMDGGTVLVRAHGEPPETFKKAAERGIKIIDATCPVVKKLQSRIRKVHENQSEKQIIIFGNPGHPELVGLAGQTNYEAFIIDHKYNGMEKIDYSKPMVLFSQTTQDLEGFNQLVSIIENKLAEKGNKQEEMFVYHDTICRQVSHRGPGLREFARKHDVMIFVGGKNSSNGKYLFGLCIAENPFSYFIETPQELQKSWFENAKSVGVGGATSTPLWQLRDVAEKVEKLLDEKETI